MNYKEIKVRLIFIEKKPRRWINSREYQCKKDIRRSYISKSHFMNAFFFDRYNNKHADQ